MPGHSVAGSAVSLAHCSSRARPTSGRTAQPLAFPAASCYEDFCLKDRGTREKKKKEKKAYCDIRLGSRVEQSRAESRGNRKKERRKKRTKRREGTRKLACRHEREERRKQGGGLFLLF